MSITYFSHARLALVAGIRGLNLKPGSEILLPDYLCRAVAEVLFFLGLTPVYYSVNPDFTVNWNSVYSARTRNTRGFILVHYFGLVGEIGRARDFCDKNHLKLIEDNAHGFGATYEGAPLGAIGDIGISAPRKVLSVPDGAFLYGLSLEKPLKEGAVSAFQVKWALKRLVKVCMQEAGLYYKIRKMPDFNKLELLDESLGLQNLRSPSKSTIRKIEGINQESLRDGRQSSWNLIHQILEKTSYPVLNKLSPGSSPLCYPIHLQYAAGDKEFIESAWKFGVEIYRWPSLPKSVLNNNGSAVKLLRSYAYIKIENSLQRY